MPLIFSILTKIIFNNWIFHFNHITITLGVKKWGCITMSIVHQQFNLNRPHPVVTRLAHVKLKLVLNVNATCTHLGSVASLRTLLRPVVFFFHSNSSSSPKPPLLFSISHSIVFWKTVAHICINEHIAVRQDRARKCAWFCTAPRPILSDSIVWCCSSIHCSRSRYHDLLYFCIN